jgi:hypothetical protein
MKVACFQGTSALSVAALRLSSKNLDDAAVQQSSRNPTAAKSGGTPYAFLTLAAGVAFAAAPAVMGTRMGQSHSK